MKPLSIKAIVSFRGKSDRSKKNFATDLKIDKVKVDKEGGGNYWITSLSAISNSYKANDLKFIIEKRVELEEKHEAEDYPRTRDMYKRNINILYKYEEFELKRLRPSKKMNFLKKNKDHSILTIKGFPIQVDPQYVFTFQKDEQEEVGAIWFIGKLNGFRKDDLGIFTDILYRYLKTHYGKKYTVNSKYCIAVDVFDKHDVNYAQLEKGEVSLILPSTLEEIKKLM